MKTTQTLELLKDFIQEAIDKGATSVQQIHEYIADLPFEALEKSGVLDHDPLNLRRRQKRTIGMVYDAIRRINKQVGDLISDQFENIEEVEHVAKTLRSQPAADKPVAKKPRKATAKKSRETA